MVQMLHDTCIEIRDPTRLFIEVDSFLALQAVQSDLPQIFKYLGTCWEILLPCTSCNSSAMKRCRHNSFTPG
jgi:hypothetical protein